MWQQMEEPRIAVLPLIIGVISVALLMDFIKVCLSLSTTVQALVYSFSGAAISAYRLMIG